MVKTKHKKRRTSHSLKTIKNKTRKRKNESEVIIQLRTMLRTNKDVRQKVLNVLNNPNAPPSWKNKTLTDVIVFFKKWLTQLVNPLNPAYNIQLFSTLTSDTPQGQILMKDPVFSIWNERFQNFRYRFLDSYASAKNMEQLVTFIPKDNGSSEGGFDMQSLPATEDGRFGNSIHGSPYQLKLAKQYNLKNKLVTKHNTSTYNINKQIMIKLFKFKTFRDFFLRRYLPGSRPLCKKPSWWMSNIKLLSNNRCITAPADGKIKWLFHSTKATDEFEIKREKMSLKQHFNTCDILTNTCNSNKYLKKFEGGPMLTTLLWFTSYHHFHAPVSGNIVSINDYETQKNDTRLILSQVGPSGVTKQDVKWQKRMLKKYGKKTSKLFNWFDYLSTHRRSTYIYDTDVEGGSNIGHVMMMPIGFYGVGSIFTKIREGDFVNKGDEVGHFEYGGSSVVLVFEPNKVDIGVPDLQTGFPFSPNSSKYMTIKVREAIGIAKQ